MAIKNTVSSNFLSSFIDCLEHFQLPPVWCEDEESDNCHKWKLTAVDPCGRNIWRSGVRSAMLAWRKATSGRLMAMVLLCTCMLIFMKSLMDKSCIFT